MEQGQASRSAMGSALLRAEHVRQDPPPWVLEDCLSASLVDDRQVAELHASMADWSPDVHAAWRLAHAVRARFAEDVAVEGLAHGRNDYVLLGAGLDTFAWRHPRAPEFRIREIDHPDTQAWKRGALRRAGLVEPGNVRFTPMDLSVVALEAAGTPGHATWNWLGVTMYLPRQATEATLRWIASHRRGTTLVVNFVLPQAQLTDDLAREVSGSAAAAVEASHEPVAAAYSAEEAGTMLRTSGFGDVSVLGSRDLSARYLGSHPDARLPSSTVIAVATV